MTELFDDDKAIVVDEEEDIVEEPRVKLSHSDARRRLEALMEEKRLQNELNDYPE